MPGDVAITPAFDLDTRYIIHASGPWWNGGNEGEAELLKACYDKSLKLAAEYDCKSIAFPLLAIGTYKFPQRLAMEIAVEVFTAFLEEHDMETCDTDTIGAIVGGAATALVILRPERYFMHSFLAFFLFTSCVEVIFPTV